MTSLFDIAADLSQFDADTRDAETRGGPRIAGGADSMRTRPLLRRESSLCILDETLQTIYGVRPAFAASPSVLGASKSKEQLEQRMRELGGATATSSPLVSPSAVTTTARAAHTATPNASSDDREPKRPRDAPTSDACTGSSSSNSADMTAKTTLRELGDEIEQLMELQQNGGASSRDVDSTARFLIEKYINARLNKLPGSPFVQLARRKALQKIQQLQQQQPIAVTSTTSGAARLKKATAAPPSSSADPLASESSEVWRRLSALTPPQHAMLQKLARVPDTHALALAQPQRELVQFARRYELARSMSARELAQLQPHQQQVVRRLQLVAASSVAESQQQQQQ